MTRGLMLGFYAGIVIGDSTMDTIMGLIVGVGLSAACGFRVFVPLLGMSIANMSGHLELSSGFEWIGSWPALITFATATVVEILAYYIPFVDNVLDVCATPMAIVAGTIATASLVGDMSPLLKWSLAAITGGSVAGVLQGGTVAIRAASTGNTGGAGNPVVSTGEWIAAAAVTVFALILPVVCFIVVLCVCYKAIRWISGLVLAKDQEPATG